MAYADYIEFLDFYQSKETDELGNIDNENPGLEESRINDALAYAASEIDQIISTRYVLPILVNVPFLKWANLVIARKNLASLDNTEKVRQDYEDVIIRLRDGYLFDESGNQIPNKPGNNDSGYYSGKMYSGSRAKNCTNINFGANVRRLPPYRY